MTWFLNAGNKSTLKKHSTQSTEQLQLLGSSTFWSPPLYWKVRLLLIHSRDAALWAFQSPFLPNISLNAHDSRKEVGEISIPIPEMSKQRPKGLLWSHKEVAKGSYLSPMPSSPVLSALPRPPLSVCFISPPLLGYRREAVWMGMKKFHAMSPTGLGCLQQDLLPALWRAVYAVSCLEIQLSKYCHAE